MPAASASAPAPLSFACLLACFHTPSHHSVDRLSLHGCGPREGGRGSDGGGNGAQEEGGGGGGGNGKCQQASLTPSSISFDDFSTSEKVESVLDSEGRLREEDGRLCCVDSAIFARKKNE